MVEATEKSIKNPTSEDELETLCRELNHNQIRYLSIFQEHPTKAEAAVALGIKASTIYCWGPEVDAAATLIKQDGIILAREIIRRAATKAAMVKTKALDSNDERIRQDAASEVLDRNIGKPTQKQEITGKDGGPVETKSYMVVSPDDWEE